MNNKLLKNTISNNITNYERILRKYETKEYDTIILLNLIEEAIFLNIKLIKRVKGSYWFKFKSKKKLIRIYLDIQNVRKHKHDV